MLRHVRFQNLEWLLLGRLEGEGSAAMNPIAIPALSKRLAAEAIAVMLVVAGIIGAGIMAQPLEGTGLTLSLLVNSVVCGAMLVVVLVVLGPVSGGHLNPAWTILTVIKREMPATEGVLYILSQVAGASVHLRSVLVHGLAFVCQSSGHNRPDAKRLLRGNRSGKCSLFCSGSVLGALAASVVFAWIFRTVDAREAQATERASPHV